MLSFIYILSLGIYIGLSFESYDSNEPMTRDDWIKHIATAFIPLVNTFAVAYYMYTRRNSH